MKLAVTPVSYMDNLQGLYEFAGTQTSVTVMSVDFDGRRQHISGLQLVFHSIPRCCTCIPFAAMHVCSTFPV
jgi:hypothetical protein